MDFTAEDMEALGAKLAGLELSDGERAALAAVIDAVTGEDEVSGFASNLFNPLGTGWLVGNPSGRDDKGVTHWDGELPRK